MYLKEKMISYMSNGKGTIFVLIVELIKKGLVSFYWLQLYKNE